MNACPLDGWGNRISYFPASSAIPGVSTLVSASQCLVQNTALFVSPAGDMRCRRDTNDAVNAVWELYRGL